MTCSGMHSSARYHPIGRRAGGRHCGAFERRARVVCPVAVLATDADHSDALPEGALGDEPHGDRATGAVPVPARLREGGRR